MTEYANYTNIDLEKFGFLGLPKHITYFKFECGTEPHNQLAEISIKYIPDIKDIDSQEKKHYRLVEVDDVQSGY